MLPYTKPSKDWASPAMIRSNNAADTEAGLADIEMSGDMKRRARDCRRGRSCGEDLYEAPSTFHQMNLL